MIATAETLVKKIFVSRACDVLGFPRSSLYRTRQPRPKREKQPRPSPPRALSPAEKETVHDVLNGERFQDKSPHQVYGTLLDEGVYYCSISTMYRILREHDEVNERRNQRRHPSYTRPELLATQPNQLWSWDITKLRGPATWSYFYLYVVLDVFSRYIVGWLMSAGESADLAEQLIAESCRKQEIDRGQLTLHADRGPAMIAKTVAQLLIDLNVAKSHSRPYTPDDNPFSEAQFKTMKYRPDYPARFESLAAAQAWAQAFFDWYNNHHRHSSLGLMTPATIHYGRAAALTAQRQVTLQAAYEQHPERFVKGLPKPPAVPTAVWINPPQSDEKGGSQS
jgi:putative transposase